MLLTDIIVKLRIYFLNNNSPYKRVITSLVAFIQSLKVKKIMTSINHRSINYTYDSYDM